MSLITKNIVMLQNTPYCIVTNVRSGVTNSANLNKLGFNPHIEIIYYIVYNMMCILKTYLIENILNVHATHIKICIQNTSMYITFDTIYLKG